MARIRTIKPEFWKHEDLSELPPETHMLAAALLNYADDEGYFNANEKLVKAECCPLRDDSTSIRRSLDELSKIGYLRLGLSEQGKRYGHIVNFLDHQRVDRPKQSKIKALEIIWDDSSKDRRKIDAGREGKGTGNGRENTGGQAAPADPFDENFKYLQALYPKRSGDQRWQTARKHIRARLREGHTWAEILEGAKRYAQWVKATGKERTETVKQAATFVGTDKAFLEPFEYQQSSNGYEFQP